MISRWPSNDKEAQLSHVLRLRVDGRRESGYIGEGKTGGRVSGPRERTTRLPRYLCSSAREIYESAPRSGTCHKDELAHDSSGTDDDDTGSLRRGGKLLVTLLMVKHRAGGALRNGAGTLYRMTRWRIW